MISTYLGYEMYAKNFTKSLENVEDEPANKTGKAYYEANIGKVKTVDDFINNYRLFSYATKAFGLEDMTYAKGLLRKVLTSDLSDSNSVANKLSDSRYKAFAQAFNFTTSGALAPTSVQSASQQSTTEDLFAANTATTLSSATAAAATAYYKANIGSVGSIADLEKNQKLYSYVMTAYGLDASTSKATFEAVVESNLASTTSRVSATAGSGYLALNQAVNVNAAGQASSAQLPAQSLASITATVTAYGAASAGMSSSTVKNETSYYGSAITKVSSVDDLLSDSRLVSFLVKAYGLPATTNTTTLRAVLTSDPSDPASFVNTMSTPGYKNLASAFNFASDGSLKTEPFQDSDQQQQTVALYTAHQSSDSTALDTATTYYEAHIGSVHSMADLEQDSKLLSYVKSAYGIASTTSNATLEQIVEADPTSTTGIIGRTQGSQYLALANAFSINAKGYAVMPPGAQSSDAVTAATTAYQAAAKTDAASQAAATSETTYYKSAIAKVATVTDLLSDTRLVAYIKQAYGIPASMSTDTLKQVLTSDPNSSSSVASRLGDVTKKLAAAFDFGKNGLLAPKAATGVQSTAQLSSTETAYNRQAMEDEAGAQNTGVQLALYFQRKAPSITSAYDILSDKALVQVFQTMLGLSSSSSKADIDAQARYLVSKVNLKDLKDPAKLDKMVQRFAAQYDMANGTSDSSSTVAALFGTSSS